MIPYWYTYLQTNPKSLNRNVYSEIRNLCAVVVLQKKTTLLFSYVSVLNKLDISNTNTLTYINKEFHYSLISILKLPEEVSGAKNIWYRWYIFKLILAEIKRDNNVLELFKYNLYITSGPLIGKITSVRVLSLVITFKSDISRTWLFFSLSSMQIPFSITAFFLYSNSHSAQLWRTSYRSHNSVKSH